MYVEIHEDSEHRRNARSRAQQIFSQALTRRGLAALYFVAGDEPLRRTEIVAAIRDAALAEGHAERLVLYADAGFDWQSLRHHLDSPSLFSAKRLIELHSGSIAVDSVPGTGTTVTVTLPAEGPRP